ncbi:hypothetical protein Stsp01_53420 [Streptomyces sp. NBRC 13847]|uniref:hypothetical protein n=1 Tax=Streptomyces TaxID=1883 RepID=UPI0024A07F8F|nr:hypothetical protein [Streptomyces sp. NBRC 13847]GLW18599.1 hypothetical protein Stsp01_53420 [Streptomyces sp. NBRC 13847]
MNVPPAGWTVTVIGVDLRHLLDATRTLTPVHDDDLYEVLLTLALFSWRHVASLCEYLPYHRHLNAR